MCYFNVALQILFQLAHLIPSSAHINCAWINNRCLKWFQDHPLYEYHDAIEAIDYLFNLEEHGSLRLNIEVEARAKQKKKQKISKKLNGWKALVSTIDVNFC